MNIPQSEFNPPDYRSMSIHILNVIIPMVMAILILAVLSVSGNRSGFVAPIVLLFGMNLAVSRLQKRDRIRESITVTLARFCASFPLLCWFAVLSRDMPYHWIFFLPQCFAITFSFLTPARLVAVLIWNAATIAFLGYLQGRMPGLFPLASLFLISLIGCSGAWILERNLILIRKLPEEDREQWRKVIGNQAIISFVMLIAGIGLTVFLIGKGLDHRRRQALAELRTQAQAGIRNLDLQLLSQRSALEAVAAFFEGSSKVERPEFETFISRLMPSHPSIKAYRWAPRVLLKDRKRFESQVSAELNEEYRIKDYGSGTMKPSPVKADYFPIRYVMPVEPDIKVLGLDIAFQPDRRACIDRAIATKAYSVCAPRRLFLNPSTEWTALAYMPVLKPELKGLVVALIPLQHLVRNALAEPLPRDFTIGLEFQSDTGWISMIPPAPPEGAVLLQEYTDMVGGTRFRLKISASRGMIGTALSRLDVLLLILGIATSILVAYFLFHARKSNLPLEIKVLDRTRELQRVVIRAEEASHAKSRFLAQMSHEIRTPLNGVLGMSEALLHSDISPDSRESVDLIKASGLNLLTILNDILDLSKIESGKMALELKSFQMGRLVSESIALMKFDADSHRVSLKLTTEEAIPEWVLGDPLRVRQILMNLLNNALKFTSRGSVTVKLGFTLPDRFKIRVLDSGIGISPDKMVRLFQPFEQGDSSTTRKFGGTGLGLVISLQLARLMGGDITVESQEGVGSEFTLTLHLSPVPQPARTGQAPPVRLRRGGRLLLAEDNMVNVRVAKALLEEYFESIDVAANGKEALDMLNSAEYEMVLMDLQMPEMDGLQATREIRKNKEWATVPIIALSANVFSSDKQDCLSAGMQDFLEKPITKAALIRVLAPYLGFDRS